MALPLTVSAQSFEILDLATLGGISSGANAISPDNFVVGWADLATGQPTPFLSIETGSMLSFGFLPFGTYGSASAISSNGQYVAGSGDISFNANTNTQGPPFSGSRVKQGFLWHQGQMQPMGAFYNPGMVSRRHGYSEAHGVNDYGQVVGVSRIYRANAPHAYLWQNGIMQDITPHFNDGNLGGSHSGAYDINNAGQIVGEYTKISNLTGNEPPYAVLWQDGVMQNLGTLPGYLQSTARAINENAQIVGWSGTDDWSHATLWQNNMIRNLGTLPGDESSRALDINDNGQITGWSGSLSQGTSHAVLWQCGQILDLNEYIPANSGWLLIEARGVNNEGNIVGVGIKNGDLRAYLLKSVASNAGRAQSRESVASNPGKARGHEQACAAGEGRGAVMNKVPFGAVSRR
jgi:probable HAF family extracellular repeat protein